MTQPEYGTPEFYAKLFSDILADVGADDLEENRQTADNIMKGFELALVSWMNYHTTAIESYRELHARFLGIPSVD